MRKWIALVLVCWGCCAGAADVPVYSTAWTVSGGGRKPDGTIYALLVSGAASVEMPVASRDTLAKGAAVTLCATVLPWNVTVGVWLFDGDENGVVTLRSLQHPEWVIRFPCGADVFLPGKKYGLKVRVE